MTDDRTPGFVDLEQRCVDCQLVFLVTAGEREFFATRGLNQPRRCKPCRRARRDQGQTEHVPARHLVHPRTTGPSDA